MFLYYYYYNDTVDTISLWTIFILKLNIGYKTSHTGIQTKLRSIEITPINDEDILLYFDIKNSPVCGGKPNSAPSR